MPSGEQQRRRLCARDRQDRFAQWLCAGDGPTVNSLADLMTGAGIDPATSPFAINAHSTSSIARSTTVLNPRVVFFPQLSDPAPYLFLGFARGDGFVEIAAYDPVLDEPTFYFVKYHRKCDPDCSNAERFSLASESGWESITAYDDEDLKNTPLDCRMCHLPDGAGTKRILRMQELTSPWSHWFQLGQDSETLLDEFLASRPGESYAGIAHSEIEQSNPGVLEFWLRQKGFDAQPNAYSSAIPFEGPRGPVWQSQFAVSRAGDAISVPYWGTSPFDPAKVAVASASYRDILDGALSPDKMPDMTDLFLESAYPDLGFTAATETTSGLAVVNHRCKICHDGRFPGISRDNFNANDYPNALTPETKRKILERIREPKHSPLRMPPILFSELSEQHLQWIEADLE